MDESVSGNSDLNDIGSDGGCNYIARAETTGYMRELGRVLAFFAVVLEGDDVPGGFIDGEDKATVGVDDIMIVTFRHAEGSEGRTRQGDEREKN